MDIASLEEEAKKAAIKQVAAMLQRPDQLEKLDQYKKRSLRKKAALEAMLKTAVQSQLEGVRTGLGQLQAATEDIKVIADSMEDVWTTLKEFSPLKDKMKTLHEESEKHSQCAAAMENLKTIYDIQSTIEQTYEEINQGKLLHAHKHLMELEQARDDVMYEVFKTQSNSEYDLNIMKAYFSEIDKLAHEIAKQLWYIMGRVLEAVRGVDPGPQQLITALRIIEREERIDKICMDRHRVSGFMSVGRPRNWRKKCFETLDKFVRQRIEGTQLEDKSLNKQWLARYLEICRMTVLQDLRVVKSGCQSCFPPEYNIYDKFIFMYHKAIVNRLREISTEPLEKNEIIQLLSWLRVYSGAEMMGHPYLAIEVQSMCADEPLLSKKTVADLVNRFVELTKNDLNEWLDKTLTQEKDEWYKGETPELDNSSGIYYTALPSILFPMVEDQVQLAKEISAEIIPHIIMVNVDELLNFANRYKDAVQAYRNKHFEDRSRFQTFTRIMISIANNCHTCVESTERLKIHVRLAVESDEFVLQSPRSSMTSVRQHLLHKIDMLKEQWTSNCRIAVTFLMDEVYADLSKFLEEILSKKWLGPTSSLETICATVEDYFEDHKHLKASLLNLLLMDIQCRIVQEYVKAVEAKRTSFRDASERKIAGDQLTHESESIKRLFSRIVPTCEGAENVFENVTDVLPAMGEIIKLGDKSLLSLEMSSFVRRFPDISVDQLSGLLQTREDVGRLEAPKLAQEIIDQNRFRPKQSGPLSKVFK